MSTRAASTLNCANLDLYKIKCAQTKEEEKEEEHEAEFNLTTTTITTTTTRRRRQNKSKNCQASERRISFHEATTKRRAGRRRSRSKSTLWREALRENGTTRPRLCQRAHPSTPMSFGILVYLAIAMLALESGLSRCDSFQMQAQKVPQVSQVSQVHPRTVNLKQRPDSSSSLFSEVEDLNDSSIRTRLGKITIEHLGDSPNDFDQLIERIVPEEARGRLGGSFAQFSDVPNLSPAGNNGQQVLGRVSADANNKTSMRFFRHDKTFASIVYTNSMQDGRKQARRLINCHLVDLEKHSSDVAIYEVKYEIQTIDVRFRDMMQIIEACTNIARLRRRAPAQLGGGSLGGHSMGGGGGGGGMSAAQSAANQIFAAPAGPSEGISGKGTTSNRNNENAALLRPTVVVGRPVAPLPVVSGNVHHQQQQQQSQQQQQPQPPSGSNLSQSLAHFNQVMSGALNRELKKLGPTVDDSSRLDLPHVAQSAHTKTAFTEEHNHPIEDNSGFSFLSSASSRSASGRSPPPPGNQQQHRQQQQHNHHMKRVEQRSHSQSGPRQRRYQTMQSAAAVRQMSYKFGKNSTNSNHQKRMDPTLEPLEQLEQLGASLEEQYHSAIRAFKRQLSSHPLVKTIKGVASEAKLVLGEVTVPPELTTGKGGKHNAAAAGSRSGASGGAGAGSDSSGKGSSMRDAIQEISSYDTSDLLSIWRGILPGTNWCGMGDRATSYNDLGFESDIDICCRAHDFCPVRLSAFSSGYGLFNWSFYTRSHCWCDQNFLDCLQQAESPLSNVVMKFYFTIMKTTCLNDNETAIAFPNTVKLQPTNKALQPHKSSRSGSLLNLIEQQAAALLAKSGIDSSKQQQQQQQQQQPRQQQQAVLQSHLGIPALRHSKVFQNRYDRH